MSLTDPGPNVLLVVLDSVRAHNCSLYDYRRDTTPRLRRLAEESVLYTQARSPSNWSLPSHVSIVTGLEAHEHRVTVHDRLLPGNTVFETLADRGYDTGLFTENGFVASHEVGLKDAFETVVTVPDSYPAEYDTTALNPGPDGFYYADAFDEWLSGRDGPWAACLNVMDAHRPFEPRDAFDEWGDDRARRLQRDLPARWEWAFHSGERPYWQLAGLESLYDGGIRQADAVVGRVLDRLRATGALDETLVVVCGDHGDGFGQPGLLPSEPPAVSHIVPMHERLLHVPLLVRPPGGTDGQSVDQPAALTAFPTAVEDAVDGRPVDDAFARETVYATKQPVTADLRQRFEDNCQSPGQFLEPSQAVYTSAADGTVLKRYYWGDEALACSLDGPGHCLWTEPTDPSSVRAAFDTTAPDIREPLAGRQVTEDSKDQLAALGYY